MDKKWIFVSVHVLYNILLYILYIFSKNNVLFVYLVNEFSLHCLKCSWMNIWFFFKSKIISAALEILYNHILPSVNFWLVVFFWTLIFLYHSEIILLLINVLMDLIVFKDINICLNVHLDLTYRYLFLLYLVHKYYVAVPEVLLASYHFAYTWEKRTVVRKLFKIK